MVYVALGIPRLRTVKRKDKHMSSTPLMISNRCDYLEDKPIEEAAKALLVLQTYDEFDEEAESLKKKIIEMYEDVPIKNNKKRYGKMTYSPSGICYYSNSNREDSYHEFEVILEPWEIDEGDITIKKKKQKTEKGPSYNYKQLGDLNSFYLYTARVLLKRRIVLNLYNNNVLFISDCIKLYESYIGLDEETKAHINLKEMMDKIDTRLNSNLRLLMGGPIMPDDNSYWYRNENNAEEERIYNDIMILTEKGAKELCKFYRDTFANGENDYCNSNEKRLLKSYILNDFPTIENCTKLNVQKPDLAYNDKNSFTYGDYSIEKFYNHMYLPMLKLSESDPFVKKTMEKMKMI